MNVIVLRICVSHNDVLMSVGVDFHFPHPTIRRLAPLVISQALAWRD